MDTNNKSISFTSNINFVNRHKFWRYHKKFYKYIDFESNDIVRAPNFITDGIRTCTGGGLTDGKKEAVGFHVLDDTFNVECLDSIIETITKFSNDSTRGLLVGGKDIFSRFSSLELFYKFKNLLTQQFENISCFEVHKYQSSETHFRYSLNDDTWTVCTQFLKRPDEEFVYDVNSVQDLRDCFRKISIAKGDKLFINNKEITAVDCPKFFKK